MRVRQARDDYQIDDETLGGQQANSLLELIKSGALKRKAPAQHEEAKASADKAAAEAAKAREQQVCSMLRNLTGSCGLLAPHGAVVAAAGIHGISDSEKSDSCARHPATEQLARGLFVRADWALSLPAAGHCHSLGCRRAVHRCAGTQRSS